MKMKEKPQLATYALAFSIFALASAIIYFTYELTNISKQIPAILQAVDQTSKEIEPVVMEIGKINNLIPSILNEWTETRKHIPLVLGEVKASREIVPLVLEEIANAREQVPVILKEVEAMRQEIPAVLETSNKAIDEVAAVRMTVPSILEEIKSTREMIPPTLDRVDQMITKGEAAVTKASTGAATNVIKGIFVAPFRLVSDLGNKLGFTQDELKGITDEDVEIMRETASVLKTASVNETTTWKNPSSGNSGVIKITKNFEQDSRECRVIRFEILKVDSEKVIKEITFCKSEEGNWAPIDIEK